MNVRQSHHPRSDSGVAVGIDVSKETLDACIIRPNGKPMHKQYENEPTGFAKLLRWAEQYARHLPEARPLHFCMEATGAYSEAPAQFLAEAEQVVSVINPFLIKHYGMATGAVTKNDKADAKLIAEYCRIEQPAPWRMCAPKVRTLLGLVRRLDALEEHRGRESNRRMEPGLVPPVSASL